MNLSPQSKPNQPLLHYCTHNFRQDTTAAATHCSCSNKTDPPKTEQETAIQDRSDFLASEEDCGRERLKRHRIEVAGKVWIPENWGQEDLLKDWIDCSVFDACLAQSGLISARAALVQEGRRANNDGLRIENRC